MKKKILTLSMLLIVSSNIFGAGPGITVHNNSGKKVWVKADKQLDKTKQSFNKEASVSNGYVSIEKGKQEHIKTNSGDRAVKWKFEGEIEYITKKAYKNPDDLTIIGDQGAYVMIERALGKKDIKDARTEEEIKKAKAKDEKEFKENQQKIAQLEKEAQKKELATQTKRAEDEAKKDAAIKQKAQEFKKAQEQKNPVSKPARPSTKPTPKKDELKTSDIKTQAQKKPDRPSTKPTSKKDELTAPDIKEFEKSQKEKEATDKAKNDAKKSQDLAKKGTQKISSEQQQANFAKAQVYRRRIAMIPALESLGKLSDEDLAKLNQNALDDIIKKTEGTDDEDDLAYIEKKTTEFVTKQTSGKVSSENLLTLMRQEIEKRKKESLEKKAAKTKK